MKGSVARWCVGLLGMVLVGTTAAGCADLQVAEAFRADAAALRDDLDARTALWQEMLDAMAPDDPARTAVQAERDQAQAAAAVVGAGVARIDDVLAEAV